MKRWEMTAHLIGTLATAEKHGDRRMSGYPISEKSGLGSGSVYIRLAALEREGLVEARWEEPNPLPPGHGRRRFYQLTDKAHRVDELLPVIFGPRMGASRVAKAIVAALRLSLDGPRDGWVSGHAIATIVRVNLRRFYQGPVYRMYGALDQLENAGLLERRDTTAPNPGPWHSDYRLRLAWAPDRPSLVVELARVLLDSCRRDELHDPAFGDVKVYWAKDGKQAADGCFGSSGARVHIVHDGIDVRLEGNDAHTLRNCGADGGQAKNAAEPPARG